MSEEHEIEVTAKADYEPPALSPLGRVGDFTQGVVGGSVTDSTDA